MKRKLKQTVALLLTCVLVVSAFGTSLSAFADDVTYDFYGNYEIIVPDICPVTGEEHTAQSGWLTSHHISDLDNAYLTIECRDGGERYIYHYAPDDIEYVDKEPTCTESGEIGYTALYYVRIITESGVQIFNSRGSGVSYPPALGHDLGDWYVSVQPTGSTDGEERRDCSRCDYYETQVIPATGHIYGTPTFEWADDFLSCVAVFECVDGDDTQRVDCTVTDSMVAATCESDGHTDYFAECEFEDNTYSDTKTVTIPATGNHTWDDGIVTVQPTDTTDGEMLYTCIVCGATKTEVIPALGHTYGEPEFDWSEFNLETGEGTVTATFTCTTCDYEETVVCEVESDEDGDDIIYTATAEFEGETYTDTMTYESEEPVAEKPDDTDEPESSTGATVPAGGSSSTGTTGGTSGNTGSTSGTVSPQTSDIISIAAVVALALASGSVGVLTLYRRKRIGNTQ